MTPVHYHPRPHDRRIVHLPPAQPETDAPVSETHDKALYCPQCSGYRAHYPKAGRYACRSCNRERGDK